MGRLADLLQEQCNIMVVGPKTTQFRAKENHVTKVTGGAMALIIFVVHIRIYFRECRHLNK